MCEDSKVSWERERVAHEHGPGRTAQFKFRSFVSIK